MYTGKSAEREKRMLLDAVSGITMNFVQQICVNFSVIMKIAYRKKIEN